MINFLDFIFVPIISFLVALLGLIVFFRNKQAVVNKAFFAFTISVNFWMISAFLSELVAVNNIKLALSKIAYVSVISMLVFLQRLIEYFSCQHRLKSEKKIISKLLLVTSVPLILLTLFTNLVIKGIKKQPWGFDLIDGDYYFLFSFFILISLALIFSKLLRTYIQSIGKLRKQIQYLSFGFIIFLVANAFVNIGLRQLIGSDKYYKLGNYSVIFFVGFFAYAIIKHRLMDIRLLVLKSVAYSLTVALVVLGYISITIYVFSILDNVINPIALNIFTIFMLLFTFDPLKHNIEKYTNKFFAKNRYNPEALWRMLDEINISYSRQEDLTKRWLKTITEQMNISKAAFLLLGSPIRFIQNLSFSEKNKKEWQELANVSLNYNKTIVYDELADDSTDRETMRNFNAEILIPIHKKDKVLGILVLGQKNSGDIYSTQDIGFLEDFANRAAVALERSKEIKAKEKEIFKIKALYNQAEKSVSGVSLDYVLNTTIDTAFMATDSDGGSIMLFNNSGELAIRASRGIPSEFGIQSIAVGEGIAGRVAMLRKPLIVDDRDPELAQLLKRSQIKSAMCVPMEVGGKLIGILSVNRIFNNNRFTDHDLELVCTVAANIAHRIENTKLIQEERKRHREVINIFAAATEARDPHTFGHSETVTLYASAIAKELGLSKGQLSIIENAAMLHDIGKIGIPDHILNKPGRLTKEEFSNIRQHPIIGERLIRQYSNLEEVAPLALHHHERYDGKGYPDQIKGKEIPLGARILAASDAFDAMTSVRPYKAALSLGQAKKELIAKAGTQFDPTVTEAFVSILDETFFADSQSKKQLSQLTRLHH